MPNIFDTVAVNKIKKSRFNLSHFVKLSGSMANLMPIQVLECLPNETYKIRHEALVKFSPLLAPMMQECDMYIEDFYVPLRLSWKNWEKFISPSDDGTYPAVPYQSISTASASRFAVGSLADYMGLPVGSDLPSNPLTINTLAFRAYQLIWNEYYRDQNLQNEINIHFEQDGAESQSSDYLDLFTIRKRCWPKDYFTSALPTTQRGGDVHLPMSGDASIVYNDPNVSSALNNLPVSFSKNANSTTPTLGIHQSAQSTAMIGYLKADMSNVTATTINELRKATALQEYLELNMRVGGRYKEYIYGNFGAIVEDYRIDRPQFLGGFRQPITVTEINQTSATQANATPLAAMAGLAYGTGSSRSIKYYSREHGFIISLLSVLPKATYQQGLPRKYTRFDPLDYANPKFANLGEQAILNKEIYAASATPNGVFGYTPRYAEYKYEPSTVHGEFKTTLNYWHMGRIFANEPALNGSFVTADPATRPFAVETGNDKLRIEVYNQVKALKPLPYYGTPKLI